VAWWRARGRLLAGAAFARHQPVPFPPFLRREEKPTSTKVQEDLKNIGSSVKQEARKVGH